LLVNVNNVTQSKDVLVIGKLQGFQHFDATIISSDARSKGQTMKLVFGLGPLAEVYQPAVNGQINGSTKGTFTTMSASNVLPLLVVTVFTKPASETDCQQIPQGQPSRLLR
jgi:hypothetical protein